MRRKVVIGTVLLAILFIAGLVIYRLVFQLPTPKKTGASSPDASQLTSQKFLGCKDYNNDANLPDLPPIIVITEDQDYQRCEVVPNGEFCDLSREDFKLDCYKSKDEKVTVISNIRRYLNPLREDSDSYNELRLLMDASQSLGKVFFKSVRLYSDYTGGNIYDYDLSAGTLKILPISSRSWDHLNARLSPDGLRFVVPVSPDGTRDLHSRTISVIDILTDTKETLTLINDERHNLFYICDFSCAWRAEWVDHRTLSYDVFTLFSEDPGRRLINPTFVETRLIRIP